MVDVLWSYSVKRQCGFLRHSVVSLTNNYGNIFCVIISVHLIHDCTVCTKSSKFFLTTDLIISITSRSTSRPQTLQKISGLKYSLQFERTCVACYQYRELINFEFCLKSVNFVQKCRLGLQDVHNCLLLLTPAVVYFTISSRILARLYCLQVNLLYNSIGFLLPHWPLKLGILVAHHILIY